MHLPSNYPKLLGLVCVVAVPLAGWFGKGIVTAWLAQLVTFGLVGAIGVGVWWRERQLSGSLRRIAAANGWTYQRTSPGLANQWRVGPFTPSEQAEARGVVRGELGGRRFAAFNFDVRTKVDDRSTTAHYSVVALDLTVDLPLVEILATYGGVEQALGVQRIEVEHEGFNRRYRVKCADPKLASDVLTPRTIEALIAGRVVNVRIGEGRAFAWALGRLEVSEVLGWSRALSTAVDLIPDFVWKDRRGSTLPRSVEASLPPLEHP